MDRTTFEGNRLETARMLFAVGAIMVREQSTEPSPIDVDLHSIDNARPGPLKPEHIQTIGKCLFQLGTRMRLSTDHVVGIPKCGQPFASAYADGYKTLRPPSLLMLVKGEDKNLLKSVGGIFSPGDTVAVIADTTTSAMSCLQAITVLQANSLKVTDVLTVIDFDQGGTNYIRSRGIAVNALFTLKNLLAIGYESGFVAHDAYRKAQTYLAQNK